MADNVVIFPREGEGFYADVTVEDHRLRLFSTISAATAGWAGHVYDLKATQWVAQGLLSHDVEQGKARAREIAEALVHQELLELEWKACP
jgi:hypothetical protein